MARKLKNISIKIVFAAVFLVFLGITIFANMLGPDLVVLSSTSTDLSFSVEVDDFDYISGTLLRKSDGNLPIFMLSFNTISKPYLGEQYGVSLSLEYATSPTVLENIEESNLDWTAFSRDSQNEHEYFNVEQETAYLGIERLVEKFKSVSGNEDASVYRQILYFRAKEDYGTPGAETYFYDSSQVWDIRVDLVDLEIKEKYGLNIQPDGFSPGIVTYYSKIVEDEGEMGLTLSFRSEATQNNINSMLFLFAVIDLDDLDNYPLNVSEITNWTSLDWQGLEAPRLELAKFNKEPILFDKEGLNSKHFYFKVVDAVSSGDGSEVEYIHTIPVEVLLNTTDDPSAIEFAEIWATDKGSGQEYSLNNPVGGSWSRSGLEVNVKLVDDIEVDEVYIELLSGIAKGGKVNFAYNSADKTYRANFFEESFEYKGLIVSSYSGSIRLVARSNSTSDKNEQLLYAYIDKAIPSLTITAKTASNDVYNIRDSWSSEDIIFSITDIESQRPISGVNYFYLSEEGWKELEREGDTRRLRVDRTSTIYFMASTGAGHTVQEEVRARIDTKKPNLKIVATETGVSGKEILSSDYVLGSGEALGNRRIGYAQDTIKFVLSNTITQDQEANTITYSYKKEGEPDSAYRIITRQSGAYMLEVDLSNSTFLAVNYLFKIEAKTGLKDIKTFKASILKSNFSVNMNIDFSNLHPVDSLTGEVASDTQELLQWYNEEIPVEFILSDNLPSLGISQYKIFSYERGSESSATEMRMEKFITNVPLGRIGLCGHIDRNVKGKVIEFYVLDKAENKVYFNASTQENMMTEPLFLDLMAPSVTVEQYVIGGNNPQLGPNDWAKGKVNIHLRVPLTGGLYPISGAACFEVINGVETGQAMEGRLIENSTVFLYEIAKEVSGNYEFKLRSGSGIAKDITVKVNIDTSEIELYEIIGKTISNDKRIAIDGTETVSSTVRIEFDTNHQSHFYYQYIEFINDPGDPIFESPLIDEDYFYIYLHEEDSQVGFKNYGFKLVSKAINQDNQRSDTGEAYYEVKIKYDIRDFKIEASYLAPPEGVWSVEPITISLWSEEEIVISKYQIRLDPISVPLGTPINWVDIDSGLLVSDNNYGMSYIFPGIKWYFNEREKQLDIDNNGLTDIGTSYQNLTEAQMMFASYKGDVHFRAISDSGKASSVWTIRILQDTSTPDPIYALHQSVGEVEVTQSGYISYSTSAFEYSKPENYDAYVNTFANKANILYYYMDATGSDTAPESLHVLGWNRLGNTEFKNLDKKKYWIGAVIEGDTKETIRLLDLRKQEKSLLVDFYEAINGNIVDQSNKTYLFSWVEMAGVSVRVYSESKVYFWYKIGAGEWLPYFETAKDPGNNYDPKIFTYIFIGDESVVGDWDYAKVINVKANMKFRVTNQAGDIKELPEIFTVQIDSRFPVLEDNIFITTLSGKELSWGSVADDWINEDVIISIGENSNASGVAYSYRVEGETNFIPIGNNKNLNTGNIISFPATGGTITITIQAKQSAHDLTIQRTISLKIDKVTPVFELTGVASRHVSDGESTNKELIGNLSNGQWTNADVVEVTISPSGPSPNSGITYERWDKSSRTWIGIDPTSVIEVVSQEEVIIRCITEAMSIAKKQPIEKRFVVNIDKIAPFIDAGPMQNPQDSIGGEKVKYYEYYIDQKILYIEDNLAKAEYNGYPLPQGHIIATNTIDNSQTIDNIPGYVHIIIEDKAGNKTELRFIMRPFPLTPAGDESGITLSQEHLDLLKKFEDQFNEALAGHSGSLTPARESYFRMQIARLKDRVATMEKQIDDYQKFLRIVEDNSTFDLQSDYMRMKFYWDKFYSEDPIILYPKWQQDKIVEGNENRFEKFNAEFAILNDKMRTVIAVEKKISLLPAINVIKASDYGRVLTEYAIYEELSNDQKAVFNANLKNKISELKRLCEVYRLQDEVTHVKISGDTLVAENPGATLKVESLAKDSGVFEQTQMTLLQTVDSSKARNIIAIHTLALGGLGSTKNLGEMVITFEIPDEYTRYKLFSVYKRTPDGTLTIMENIERSPDGKTVFFSSNELGTFVLANAANVHPRDESDQVYGSFAGVEVDVVVLNYITYTVLALFVIFIIVITIVGLRRRKFLSKYNRAHKSALMRRGIDNIPKGNPEPASNPARPEERVPQSEVVMMGDKKD